MRREGRGGKGEAGKDERKERRAGLPTSVYVYPELVWHPSANHLGHTCLGPLALPSTHPAHTTVH